MGLNSNPKSITFRPCYSLMGLKSGIAQLVSILTKPEGMNPPKGLVPSYAGRAAWFRVTPVHMTARHQDQSFDDEVRLYPCKHRFPTKSWVEIGVVLANIGSPSDSISLLTLYMWTLDIYEGSLSIYGLPCLIILANRLEGQALRQGGGLVDQRWAVPPGPKVLCRCFTLIN